MQWRALAAKFAHSAPVRAAVAPIAGFPSWARRIIKRKENKVVQQADRVWENEQSLLRALIDNIPDFIYVKDTQSRFLVANLSVAQAMGAKTPEGLLGKTDFDFYPEEVARGFFEREQEIFRTGAPLYRLEERAIDSEGKERVFLTSKVPLRDGNGRLTGLAGTGHDITEQVQMMNALREANLAREKEQNLLRALIDNIPSFIYAKDTESRFLIANRHLASVVGVQSPDELLGKTDFDFFPGELAAGYFADEQDIIRTEKPLRGREEKVVDSQGNETIIQTTKVPLRDSLGQVIGIVGMGDDITERVQMMNALREAHLARENERNMLRALIDNIPSFIYAKDTQSRYVIANQHLARAVGAQSPDELLGKTDFDFYPEDLARGFYEREQEIFRSGAGFYRLDEKAIDSEGKERVLLTTKVPLSDSSGQLTTLACIGHDVTETRQIQNAQREAELKYRGIFDKAIVGMFQSNPDGRFINVNPSLAFALGYHSPEEMIADHAELGRRFFVDPKRGAQFLLIMDRVGGVKDFECEVFQKDGNKIWLAMNIRAIRENGAVVRYEGMCEDVTERKHLRTQLLQAQKLESVGQLAAGIAHEINTPAQYVGDNVRFLKDLFPSLLEVLGVQERLLAEAKAGAVSPHTLEETEAAMERADVHYLMEEIPKAIDQTLEGIGRVTGLVSAMKEFSHPGTKEKVLTDLNHAIESTITVSRNEWKYAAEMETEFDRTLPPVLCNPGEFNQVILNLIVNAAHAIAEANGKRGVERGNITVQTRNDGEYAEIRIRDTGTGIPEEVRNRIFDPFFTTKEIGKGTGQGLAIARSVVVDKHGGTLDFETQEGVGTTFIVRLPCKSKEPAKMAAVA